MKSICLSVVVLVFASAILVSCMNVIELDPRDEGQRIMVEGGIMQGAGPHQITLRYAKAIFDGGDFIPAENAVVQIAGDTSVELLNEIAPGIYESTSLFASESETFHLNIVAAGEIYEANAVLSGSAAIDTLIFFHPPDDTIFGFPFVYPDSVRHIKIVLENAIVPDAYIEISYFINGEFFSSENLALTESFGDLPTDTLSSEWISFFQGDSAAVEIRTIEKGYYEYLQAIQNYPSNISPFGKPSPQLPGNISNNAFGYFHANGFSAASDLVE